MSDPDPWQAILEHLSRPAGRWESGPAAAGGVQAAMVRGENNPFNADASSARCVKHRSSEHRQVWFVTFEGEIPQLGPDRYDFSYVFALDRDRRGDWRVSGGGGGAGGAPARSTPWVNLAGGGWPRRFYAGGRIDRADVDVARVALRFANGLTLEDDSDHGVALFICEEIAELPATVALYDAAGHEVASHPAFGGIRPRPSGSDR